MTTRHNPNAAAHRQASPTQRQPGHQPSPAPRQAASTGHQTTHQTPKPKPKPKYTDNKPSHQTPKPKPNYTENKPTHQTPKPKQKYTDNKLTHQTPKPKQKYTDNKPTHQTPKPKPKYKDNKPTHQTPKPKPKYTDNKPTVRFYCKAKSDYSLSIRDGSVVIAPFNSSDNHQHWIKERKFSTEVKDKEGFSSFALVNKATGQALKHAAGARKAVQLTRYNPDNVDNSVLWTQRMVSGDVFHTIRMVNNIKLNLDIASLLFNDGNIVGVGESTRGDNQRWRTAPYSYTEVTSSWFCC